MSLLAKRPAVLACFLVFTASALQSARAADDFFFDNGAQTPSPITDRMALSASFFHASVDTELRVDPPGRPLFGTEVSGARDLGFKPSENDGLVDLMFRLRERNRITAGYLELDEAATTTVSRPIVFGNEVFNPGSVVSTSLQWRVTSFSWTYALIQNDRFELGAGLGVHLMDLDVRGTDPATFSKYDTSIAGALPTPALDTAWRITRRISLTARAQYLKAASDGTSGSLGDFHADAQFRWVPNLSIGAGYSQLQVKLASVTDSNPGVVSIRLRGPEIFLRASF
jgi:hypothetical protein